MKFPRRLQNTFPNILLKDFPQKFHGKFQNKLPNKLQPSQFPFFFFYFDLNIIYIDSSKIDFNI